MKLKLLSRDNPSNSSFTVTKHSVPFFLRVWHHHPELELVLTLKSTGTRFVGDSIKKFNEGDLVLIGKNLPHMWLNDEEYFEEGSTLVAEDVVVHFKKDFLGYGFMETNEMKHISRLMNIADYGIKFLNIDPRVVTAISGISHLEEGFGRTMKFIGILDGLANHKEVELLTSEPFLKSFKTNQNEILDKTFEYVFENFSNPITLNDVAKVANMNPSAFSRFFRRANHKTFSSYLNEVRIGYACRLLTERKLNIATICYESGFNNISNFNRQFRAYVHMSPTQYRATYRDNG